MDVVVKSGKLSGTIVAPPSKSVAHRALISAFLSKNATVLGVGESGDVTATINALKSLENAKKGTVINCKESGSSLRFLLPLACALGAPVTFTGEGRLLSRPIDELINVLNKHGADINGLTVNGKLTAGEYQIDATISSQFITGLMLALPILDGDSKIVFKGKPVSIGYQEITKAVLKDFGVVIQDTDYGYYILGNQKFNLSTPYVVEGDFSGSAFMLASGAINGKVRVENLNINTKQGDSKIVQALKSFGAKVSVEDNAVTVESDKLNGIEIDCEDIPDLAQILAVVGAFSKGKTILKNIQRLELKESNRINAIISQLNTAGIDCKYESGSLVITGASPKGNIFSGGNDHRTAMSATILALHASGESKVVGAEVVKKSYVNFFDDVKALGGDIDLLL